MRDAHNGTMKIGIRGEEKGIRNGRACTSFEGII